jgi:hypothetical protein
LELQRRERALVSFTEGCYSYTATDLVEKKDDTTLSISKFHVIDLSSDSEEGGDGIEVEWDNNDVEAPES